MRDRVAYICMCECLSQSSECCLVSKCSQPFSVVSICSMSIAKLLSVASIVKCCVCNVGVVDLRDVKEHGERSCSLHLYV